MNFRSNNPWVANKHISLPELFGNKKNTIQDCGSSSITTNNTTNNTNSTVVSYDTEILSNGNHLLTIRVNLGVPLKNLEFGPLPETPNEMLKYLPMVKKKVNLL